VVVDKLLDTVASEGNESKTVVVVVVGVHVLIAVEIVESNTLRGAAYEGDIVEAGNEYIGLLEDEVWGNRNLFPTNSTWIATMMSFFGWEWRWMAQLCRQNQRIGSMFVGLCQYSSILYKIFCNFRVISFYGTQNSNSSIIISIYRRPFR
jgi:hypothetical protein